MSAGEAKFQMQTLAKIRYNIFHLKNTRLIIFLIAIDYSLLQKSFVMESGVRIEKSAENVQNTYNRTLPVCNSIFMFNRCD